MKKGFNSRNIGMLSLLFLFLVFTAISCKNQSKPSQDDQEKTRDKATEPAADSSSEQLKASAPDTTGMVYFEAGRFMMGNEGGAPDQQPAHEQQVKPFYLGKHPVTVAEFRRFVEETGYSTEADSYGNAGVFLFDQGRWNLVDGANWEYPLGPSGPEAKENHPVTQVSWRDARAYCQWAGKQLPTEKQWEYAATNGGELEARYPWGNKKVQVNGRYRANVWQGTIQNPKVADGFKLTSPVGHYGAHPSGLTDMAGNVWEWCRDVYHAYPGSQASIRENPKVRVIRGGSFFYDQAGAGSYTVTYRSKNTIETSLFNLGFRCAYNPDR